MQFEDEPSLILNSTRKSHSQHRHPLRYTHASTNMQVQILILIPVKICKVFRWKYCNKYQFNFYMFVSGYGFLNGLKFPVIIKENERMWVNRKDLHSDKTIFRLYFYFLYIWLYYTFCFSILVHTFQPRHELSFTLHALSYRRNIDSLSLHYLYY